MSKLRYLVASPEFWASIPFTRQLTCGRVKFTNAPMGIQGYPTKALAIQALTDKLEHLILETHYSENVWHYQLLLGSTEHERT